MHRFTFLAPLDNFHSDQTEIILSKNITIRRIEEKEINSFKYLAERWQNLKFDKYLIECTLTKKEPEAIPRQYIPEGRELIERVITVLRLFKQQITGYNFITQPYSDEPYSLSAAFLRHYEHWINTDIEEYARKYSILKDDLSTLRELYCNLDISAFKKVEIAIHYFNKSYIEPYTPRDSFLDLMFALENLFLKGEQLELGYKLRMRMACVLEQEYEKRLEVFNDIRNAYSIRGKIVHGEKAPKLDYHLLFKMRDYARSSLKLFLKCPNLMNELDKYILKGELDGKNS